MQKSDREDRNSHTRGPAEIRISSEEISRLRNAGLGGGICAGLASRSVEREISLRFPEKIAHHVSSNVVTLRPLSEDALTARAELMAGEASPRQVWRIAISQGKGDQAETVAEVTSVYDLRISVDRSKGVAAERLPDSPGEPPVNNSRLQEKYSNSATRRRQIFEGACNVIARKGFGNASIREIAEAAGMSVPLMYKHIKDKDDILYLITSECMRDIIDYFGSSEGFSNSPVENIGHAIEQYVDYINENRRLINLVYSETRSLNADNRQKIFAMERKFMEYWKNLVTAGIDKGVFKPVDAELAANYIYFLCTVWSLRYWSIGHFDEAEIKATLKDFVLSGITKPAD